MVCDLQHVFVFQIPTDSVTESTNYAMSDWEFRVESRNVESKSQTNFL